MNTRLPCKLNRRHRVMIVEEWTPLGAVCSCIECDTTLHIEQPVIDRTYVGFTHTSERGPSGDTCILVRADELGARVG